MSICKRLDGIPLALELAAGRARDLPLSHIVAGLNERFGLLVCTGVVPPYLVSTRCVG